MSVDVLAIGAHPDDADLGVGGFLCTLADAGKTTAILDLTQGELGSRGTVAEREVEAAESARLLGLTARINARLPDGGIANTPEQRRVVVEIIRQLRPRIVIGPLRPDRHPDHEAAHDLVKDAHFFSGVHGLKTESPAYRAQSLYGYTAYFEGANTPTHVVDISAVFDRKLEALRAFKSQLHNVDYNGPETLVASSQFWDAITTRAAYWGNTIGVRYGEPLYGTLPLAMNLPPELEEPS